jgi:CheY-like chemotaxis protein
MGSQNPSIDHSPLATIMVVDDETSIRNLLSRFLTKSGYKVLESADGRDALEQLRHCKIDLLISDIVMPERDGLEILRSIRRDFADLKIIVMSGAFEGRFLRTAEMLGAHATLQKPLRLNLVLETVQEVLTADYSRG